MNKLNELPESCIAISPVTGEMVRIVKGESFMQALRPKEKEFVIGTAQNVPRNVVSAMVGGCMNGWDSVSADPDNYDVFGKWKGKPGYGGQEPQ